MHTVRILSMGKARLALCRATEKILVFDQYVVESVKDHERRRRAGVGSTTFNLAMNSPLPSREAVIKKKKQAWPLPSSRYVQFEVWVTVDSIDDGVFGHDEADITIISYMLRAADDGCHVVRVPSDNTDIFVLLFYWTCRCDLQDRLTVQMEKWNGVGLDVNATCCHSGSIVCSHLLGAHAITGQVRNKEESMMLEHQVCAKSAGTCSLQ